MASSPRSRPRASADASDQTPATHEAERRSGSLEMSTLAPPAAEANAVASPSTAPQDPSVERAAVKHEAIGPASDTLAAKPDAASGPQAVITLLLINGSRYACRMDSKYLQKHNIPVESTDPFSISVYTLKELIWRDWRQEWDPRPSSPSSIRLISFGRMLNDKHALKEYRLQPGSPNVVHMTIKPQDAVEEEDAKTAKATGHDNDEHETTARCRCVVL